MELQVQSATQPTKSLSSCSEAQFHCENKLMDYLLCMQEPNLSQSLWFLIAALQSLVLEFVRVLFCFCFFLKEEFSWGTVQWLSLTSELWCFHSSVWFVSAIIPLAHKHSAASALFPPRYKRITTTTPPCSVSASKPHTHIHTHTYKHMLVLFARTFLTPVFSWHLDFKFNNSSPPKLAI